MIKTSKLLPSLAHATSGSAATALSTLLTYPLDLVNTRLKVQRQLRLDGTIPDGARTYDGVWDAFCAIYDREGGVGALFAGLGPDLGKSVADSFLFFLFYTWFRARRLRTHESIDAKKYLSALEELAVGAAAGACAKAFTTPVSNVVTRQQTASLRDTTTGSNEKEKTFRATIDEIRREKGILGLWAGYSASLVLTLNPSMTFFLQQMLKRLIIPRERWDEPGGRATFLLAALSKVSATTVTYPFQIAKARVQVSTAPDEKKGGHSIGRETIFTTVFRIWRGEGVAALYDGIGGELLKGFFSHGTTMLFKDIIHGFLVRVYLGLLVFLQRYPRIKARLLDKMRSDKGGLKREYRWAIRVGRRGTRIVRNTIITGETTFKSLLGGSQTSL